MKKPFHLSELATDQLRYLIQNYERKEMTQDPVYLEAVEENERRKGSGLRIEVTIATIMAAARRREFISYGAIAEANGCAWAGGMYRQMPGHLDAAMVRAHAHGAPLITSVVVNQGNLRTGKLDAKSLAGFIRGARRLGIPVGDELAFLRSQQEATFAYAASPEKGGVQ